MAHARVASIKTFEKVLQDNTPFTSINDSEALAEYLTQINRKGDLVMEELRRVTQEKDNFKKKTDEAEKELAILKDKLAMLDVAGPGAEHSKIPDAAVAATDVEPADMSDRPHTPTSTKSPIFRVLTAFSPRHKDEAPKDDRHGGSEDFFSADSEFRHLQAENEKKTAEILELQTEIRNLKEARDSLQQSQDARLEDKNSEIVTLTRSLDDAKSRVKDLQTQLETASDEAAKRLEEKTTKLAESISQNQELRAQMEKEKDEAAKKLEEKAAGLAEATSENQNLKVNLTTLTKRCDTLAEVNKSLELQIKTPTLKADGDRDAGETSKQPEATLSVPAAGASSKKKNRKKKKKGGVAASSATEAAPSEASDLMPLSDLEDAPNAEMQAELTRLRGEVTEKDQLIEKLSKQRKSEEDLSEDVESLREDLLVIGNDCVEAKRKIQELEAEKKQLKERISELEKEVESLASTAKTDAKIQDEQMSLKELEDVTLKSSTLQTQLSILQTELAATEQLAQSRFKEAKHLKDLIEKLQPELTSLREESATLKIIKEELAAKNADLCNLEKREKEVRADLSRAQRLAANREIEVKNLQDKAKAETNARVRMEDEKRVAGRDLRRSEAEKVTLAAKEEKATRELQRVEEEASKLRPRVKELLDQVARLEEEHIALREDAKLKASHYDSAQNLISGMRDQARELRVQLEESRGECESLNEELAETRKMLDERKREADKMRSLLANARQSADNKERDVRERMERAVEERDTFEEQLSTLARSKSREAEEYRHKIRDLQREVKELAGEKADLELKEREWRRRHDELESYEEKTNTEVSEMRETISKLRTTLDASEAQARDMMEEHSKLRRALDEKELQHEKASKELRAVKEKIAAKGDEVTAPNAMYMKTVLLQFLEQKDNRMREQLVPVLGKLLQFDKLVFPRPLTLSNPQSRKLTTCDADRTSKNGGQRSSTLAAPGSNAPDQPDIMVIGHIQRQTASVFQTPA